MDRTITKIYFLENLCRLLTLYIVHSQITENDSSIRIYTKHDANSSMSFAKILHTCFGFVTIKTCQISLNAVKVLGIRLYAYRDSSSGFMTRNCGRSITKRNEFLKRENKSVS